MPSHRLAVNAQLPGDVPVRPAASCKCQNCLYFRHLELIGHPVAVSRLNPEADGNDLISCLSKWPVLPRPSVAGFARPMTLHAAEHVGDARDVVVGVGLGIDPLL